MTATVIAADELVVRTASGRTLVESVSLAFVPGELVAIVGRSGAGKTSLLRALAGLRPPTSGSIHVNARARAIGYVPQDDIVHAELTVSETIRFAAQLRHRFDERALGVTVANTIDVLDLTDRADDIVGTLSGGQRKRVSIATEIVTRPDACLLDEPTSGLDAQAADELVRTLRALADGGAAVVFTTHHLADLRDVDRVIVVAPGGSVDFDGPAVEAPGPYRVDDLRGFGVRADGTVRAARAVPSDSPSVPPRESPSWWSQTRTLSHRNLIVLTRNRMSGAIMAGSPVAVVAMLAILFRPGSAGSAPMNPDIARALAYWLAFAGFFFGLTFGLLQVCTELSIARRELHATISPGSYLLAKSAVLMPVLVVVNVSTITVLVAISRLEGLTMPELLVLFAVLGVDATAGLAIGLLASCAVANPTQATLALPMLCFPAVLFGGAIVPVASMTAPGRALAGTTSTRWAFDATAAIIAGGDRGVVRSAMFMSVIGVMAAIAARHTLARRTTAVR
jgi:ABC-type multidrug transport system ATPase subunit